MKLELLNLAYIHESTFAVRDAYVRDAYVRDAYVRDAYVRDAYVRDAYVRDAYVRDAYVRLLKLLGNAAVTPETCAEPVHSFNLFHQNCM
jgi:hypothetical protein